MRPDTLFLLYIPAAAVEVEVLNNVVWKGWGNDRFQKVCKYQR